MPIGNPDTHEHETQREQGCSATAERNSRGWTISAKVWDTDDASALSRLKALTDELEKLYPAQIKP